jgi:L-rhamnose mutarotase
MFLKPGAEAEYRRRHDEIWPELAQLLRDTGVSEYLIYFDPATDALFALVDETDAADKTWIGAYPVMQRWWQYMADLMLTNEDQSPVTGNLIQVFRLKT